MPWFSFPFKAPTRSFYRDTAAKADLFAARLPQFPWRVFCAGTGLLKLELYIPSKIIGILPEYLTPKFAFPSSKGDLRRHRAESVSSSGQAYKSAPDSWGIGR
jgi:hypothetical protein